MTSYDDTGQVRLDSPDQTRDFGRALSAHLRAGDLLVLTGPLGAGKTALTQGIGMGLGVRGPVTSPTFVLARVHPGPLPLVHVDAYRVRDLGSQGLEGLDLELALEDSVVVIEWGEGLAAALTGSWLQVELSRPPAPDGGVGRAETDESTRYARVWGHGPRWAAVQVPWLRGANSGQGG